MMAMLTNSSGKHASSLEKTHANILVLSYHTRAVLLYFRLSRASQVAINRCLVTLTSTMYATLDSLQWLVGAARVFGL
jgi:hypothetical protein